MEIARTAAFYRDGLLSGLIPLQTPIVWADALIMRGSELPAEIYDLSLAGSRGISHVTDVLDALARGVEASTVVPPLLDLIQRDLSSQRIDLATAVGAIGRVKDSVSAHMDLHWELVSLVEDYALVADSIASDGHTIRHDLVALLSRFAGASHDYLDEAV